MSTCAALSAAFVNGMKSFGVDGNDIMLMPILKFSYYKLLTDKKLSILKILHKHGQLTLEDLKTKTKMSFPLLSYRVNGNLRSGGLNQLDLVETVVESGRSKIKISTLGRLLIKGYIVMPDE